LPVRLNKELTFGESMTNDMVQALMITLPGKDTTLRRLTFQKAPVVMRLEGGELTITLDEVRETRYLILQGTQAASVMVGTSELPNLDKKGDRQSPVGWYIDNKINRTVVKLP